MAGILSFPHGRLQPSEPEFNGISVNSVATLPPTNRIRPIVFVPWRFIPVPELGIIPEKTSLRWDVNQAGKTQYSNEYPALCFIPRNYPLNRAQQFESFCAGPQTIHGFENAIQYLQVQIRGRIAGFRDKPIEIEGNVVWVRMSNASPFVALKIQNIQVVLSLWFECAADRTREAIPSRLSGKRMSWHI
jgi:hypothetical protein